MVTKPLKGFVKKCCLIADNARYPALELYLTYVNWCINTGSPIVDQFAFLELLNQSGFHYRHTKKGCWFKGISVLPNYRVV